MIIKDAENYVIYYHLSENLRSAFGVLPINVWTHIEAQERHGI